MLLISELNKVKSFKLPAFDTLTVRFGAGFTGWKNNFQNFVVRVQHLIYRCSVCKILKIILPC